jgi:hypothetical protein
MALARVSGEGLRWPSVGFRRESIVFSYRPFQKTDLAGEWLGIGPQESLHLVFRPDDAHPQVTRDPLASSRPVQTTIDTLVEMLCRVGKPVKLAIS